MLHSSMMDSDAANGPGAGRLDVDALEGFSYLLGQPDASQRSAFFADIEAARPVLAALVRALPAAASPEAPTTGPHPVWSTSLAADDPGVNIDDNPFIPAGYTYLLQFVAHDIVQTTVPFWAAVDAGVPSGNARHASLRLDTLYGGGPAVCPVAYETAGNAADDRALLRLGHVNPGTPPLELSGPCQFRDLARVNLIYRPASRANPLDSANFDNANQAMIADPRNDDSILLAQITVLFSIVHNIIAKCMARPLHAEARFGHARAAVQHIYYNIIGQDLLPRLLHREVHARIKDRAADDPAWLWQAPGVPLEFSHGAFRVGHAMVRNRYRLNAGAEDKVGIVTIVHGNRSVADARGLMPASWVVQWSHFFPGLGVTPNFSRRIGPTQSRLDPGRLFLNRHAAPDGIVLRDLLSATLAQSWTVEAMIRAIEARSPDLIPRSWPFRDPDWRRHTIRRWLTTTAAAARDLDQPVLSQALAALEADLPLPVFVLLEAALDPAVGGRSMGVLGSIIVAEVICKRLAEERARLAPRMGAVQAALRASGVWDQIDRLSSMRDLVLFAARNGELGHCAALPFV